MGNSVVKLFIGRLRRRTRAFTFIEVSVAVALLAIFATLITLHLTEVRRLARDSRRQSDVQTYVAALSQYLTATGTLFVTDAADKCVIQNDANGDPEQGIGRDCTGVSGFGYGLMNAASASVTDFGGSNREYPRTSIAQALQNRGLITAIGTDPNYVKGGGTNQPDYVLIRCCSNSSKQNRSKTGQAFAVWTVLERLPTDNEASNSNRACGAKVLQQGRAVYDLGINDTDAGSVMRTAFETHGVAVANTGLQPISESSCCISVTGVALNN